MKKTTLYISLHIPKCGGTWLEHMIRDRYDPQSSCFLYKDAKKLPSYESIDFLTAYFHFLPQNIAGNLRIIHGHGAFWGIHEFFPKRDSRYITVLRDPVARTISHYTYYIETFTLKPNRQSLINQNGQLRSFKNWIQNTLEMQNFMTRFLYHRLYRTEISGNVQQEHYDDVIIGLKRFYFVGVLENADHMNSLRNMLGITKAKPPINRSKIRLETTKKDESLVRKLNYYDLKLYSIFQSAITI